MSKVLNSRKFWFGLVLPIVIQAVALYLKVIDATTFIAALTTTTSFYTGSVAYEDGEQAKSRSAVTVAQVEAGASVDVARTEAQTARGQ